ncbi:MAG TPA: hypothetical protein DEP87_02440 [Candidatus Pacebacteria bacterium]|nr:hypothetical protein [Candidatus Paceibacterota bacterium]
MQTNSRYPIINIGSKNELAKRLSSKNFSKDKSLELINNVLANFDKYWYDSKKSDPEKQKFFRSSVGTPLHKLLKLINAKILKVYDKSLPEFIFGGVSDRNHILAARELIGNKNDRTLLKIDVSRFFEQITMQRIVRFFHQKCNCSLRASYLLASLCCVPGGQKDSSANMQKYLARGFPTSSRLAVWTNLDTFLRLKWETNKRLKNHDPKIVIFVDDIGVSASRVDIKTINCLKESLIGLLESYDINQPLPVNHKKTEIIAFKNGAEHLGMRLGKNKISIGRKTISNKSKLNNSIKTSDGLGKSLLLKKKAAYYQYLKQIEQVNDMA